MVFEDLLARIGADCRRTSATKMEKVARSRLPGTYRHDAQMDYFRIADQADKNLCDSPLILDCPRAVMGP
jgi:hypothetical protein